MAPRKNGDYLMRHFNYVNKSYENFDMAGLLCGISNWPSMGLANERCSCWEMFIDF
jgi:hypothetical protein